MKSLIASSGLLTGGADPSPVEMRIERPVYNQAKFDETFQRRDDGQEAVEETTPAVERLRRGVRRRLVSAKELKPRDVGRHVLKYLPVVRHLKDYRWKAWLIRDIVSGLSGGVVHVPQGMGFALLAGLPPVYGLYTSIFPGWFYYLFGTSRHLSVGTMALTALMVGAVVNRVVPPGQALQSNSTSPPNDMWLATTQASDVSVTSSSSHVTDFTMSTAITRTQQQQQEDELIALKVGVAMSVTLIAGLFQTLMRVCRLGIIANYMSMPFIGGFMTGAALQIMISQIPFQLGLAFRRPSGLFESPLLIYEVFGHIKETNICALIASIVSLIFLISVKEGINEQCKSRLKIPIPAELILVVVGTIASHFARLHVRYGLAVIGMIPTGLPTPRVPPIAGSTDYIVDGLVLGVVGFAIAVSMAKLMADRHRYEIDVSQELLACAVYNVVGSFFSCFVATQAPPRTLVHETTGCRTQMAGLISTVLPLLVVLCLGPLFEDLPTSVLGCIIMCALLPLMKQFPTLKPLWIVNPFDCVVWIVTFLCTVVLSVTVGLGVGIGLSVLLTLVQAQRVRGQRLTQAGNTEIYYVTRNAASADAESADVIEEEKKAEQSAAVVVYRYGGSIFFANVDRFVDDLYRSTFYPDRLTARRAAIVKAGRQATKNVGTAGCLGRLRRGQGPLGGRAAKAEMDRQFSDESDLALNTSCSVLELQRSEVTNKPAPDMENGTGQIREGNRQTEFIVGSGESSWPGGAGEPMVSATNSEPAATATTKRNGVVMTAADDEPSIDTIVLDCSAVSTVDVMGVNAIKKIWTAFGLTGVNVVASGCNDELQRKMRVIGMLRPTAATTTLEQKGNEAAGSDAADSMEIYPTVQDAVAAARQKYAAY